MSKFETFFEKANPVIGKITTNKTLQAISASMMGLFPITIIGSLCLLLYVVSAQVAPLGEFFTTTGIGAVLLKVNSLTIGLLAVYVVVLMAKNIAKTFSKDDDGISAGIIALLCFLIVTPLGASQEAGTFIPTTWLGATGIFSAMVIGILVARIYVFTKNKGWTIKMPAGVPPMVSKVFESLIPSILIGIIFMIINFIFALTSFGNMHQAIYSIIQTPLQGLGGNIWAMVLFTIIAQTLWFFGIHGTSCRSDLYTNLDGYGCGKHECGCGRK